MPPKGDISMRQPGAVLKVHSYLYPGLFAVRFLEDGRIKLVRQDDANPRRTASEGLLTRPAG
jgi:hypothetical protein